MRILKRSTQIALTNDTLNTKSRRVNGFTLVSRAGLEPATLCLKGTCSTT